MLLCARNLPGTCVRKFHWGSSLTTARTKPQPLCGNAKPFGQRQQFGLRWQRLGQQPFANGLRCDGPSRKPAVEKAGNLCRAGNRRTEALKLVFQTSAEISPDLLIGAFHAEKVATREITFGNYIACNLVTLSYHNARRISQKREKHMETVLAIYLLATTFSVVACCFIARSRGANVTEWGRTGWYSASSPFPWVVLQAAQ